MYTLKTHTYTHIHAENTLVRALANTTLLNPCVVYVCLSHSLSLCVCVCADVSGVCRGRGGRCVWCVYVCVYVYICVHVCVCVCVCVYVCVQTNNNDQVFKMKQGSHPCYLDKPTQFNKKILKFLARATKTSEKKLVGYYFIGLYGMWNILESIFC